MGIASEMKELTRNIASSRKERGKRVSEIKEEANETRVEAQCLIMGFEAFCQETNQQVRRDLTQEKALRKSETSSILKDAQDILKSFQASRKETSTQIRTDLTEGTAGRRAELNKALGDARNLIRGCHVSR